MDNESHAEFTKHGNGYIYIISTDIEGIYKCGRTKRKITHRVRDLQTNCVRTIRILFLYPVIDTSEILLESVVHNLLDKYRIGCGNDLEPSYEIENKIPREHFKCSLELLKNTIVLAGTFLSQMKLACEMETGSLSEEHVGSSPFRGTSSPKESVPNGDTVFPPKESDSVTGSHSGSDSVTVFPEGSYPQGVTGSPKESILTNFLDLTHTFFTEAKRGKKSEKIDLVNQKVFVKSRFF